MKNGDDLENNDAKKIMVKKIKKKIIVNGDEKNLI